jgi:hypothetical protein
MMKKTFIVVIFTFLIANNLTLFSQNYNYFWLSMSGGYGWQFAEKGKQDRIDPDNPKTMANFDFSLGYYLTPQFSLGLGIGANAYQNTKLTAFPVFIDLRYNFENLPRLFTYLDIGVPLGAETASTDFFGGFLGNYNHKYKSGFLTNVGLGWRIPLNKTTTVRSSIDYQFFPFSTTHYEGDNMLTNNMIKHSLSLQLGVEFSLAPVYGEKAKMEQRNRRKEFWLKELILILFGYGSSR